MTKKMSCNNDHIINKLIIKNKDVFERIHKKKGGSLISHTYENSEIITIPVTINICLTYKKYKIDFVKYANYIVNMLNSGFSGNSVSKYKDNNIYNIDFFINELLEKYEIDNATSYANQIYKYINTATDTKIRFYLESIEYFDIDFEYYFEGTNTEKMVEEFIANGFSIRESNQKNMNINIINFTCNTLGVSIFPWYKYILKNMPNIMQVFIDYKTIHPDIYKSYFNQCKTLVHEVGHVLGLIHTFTNNGSSLEIYRILLGKIIYEKEFLNTINENNINNIIKYSNLSKDDVEKDKLDKDDIVYVNKSINQKDHKLYIDVPVQVVPTFHNPIEKKNYPIHNNIPSNFCCFMDYSHDEVLTHFTLSQARIMHYMIRIFYPFIIKNSKKTINISELSTILKDDTSGTAIVKVYIKNKINLANNTAFFDNNIKNNSKIYTYNIIYNNEINYTIQDCDTDNTKKTENNTKKIKKKIKTLFKSFNHHDLELLDKILDNI
jgi:hypothetical protein